MFQKISMWLFGRRYEKFIAKVRKRRGRFFKDRSEWYDEEKIHIPWPHIRKDPNKPIEVPNPVYPGSALWPRGG